MSVHPIETPGLRLSGRPLSGAVTTPISSGEMEPSGPATGSSKVARFRNAPLVVALLDQGIVSCGNFLTNVMLARVLPVDQYGIFALFLDAILFLNSLQAALLIYPLTVRCAAINENELRRCAGACVLLTFFMAVPLGLALAIYGVFIGAASVAVWAVLGQTFWQCQETLRRTLLARKNYSRALIGDSISYLGQVIILALLVLGHKADVSHAFIAMAVTSIAAAAVQGFQIGASLVGLKALAKLMRNFWLMGRWVMTANLTNLITSVGCSYVLARSHGNTAMGQYAALSNLLRIANPLFITLATLIVPAVASVSANGDSPHAIASAWRISRGYGLRGAALLVPYWSMLLLFPGHAIVLLYPKRTEYFGLGADLRILVGISMLTLLNAVAASFFNGLRRNRRAMLAQFLGAVACLLVTIPLTIRFGLSGMLTGTLLSTAMIVGAQIFLSILLARELGATDKPAHGDELAVR